MKPNAAALGSVTAGRRDSGCVLLLRGCCWQACRSKRAGDWGAPVIGGLGDWTRYAGGPTRAPTPGPANVPRCEAFVPLSEHAGRCAPRPRPWRVWTLSLASAAGSWGDSLGKISPVRLGPGGWKGCAVSMRLVNDGLQQQGTPTHRTV